MQASRTHPRSTVLLPEGIDVVFQGVTLWSEIKRATVILSNVTGVLQGAQMTALMGPSGSGKTSLLNVLAGRLPTRLWDGRLTYSNLPPTKSFFRHFVGYVEQEDILIPNLTVHETLLYTAELKCPPELANESKRRRVIMLTNCLGLDGCRNTRIMSKSRRCISGMGGQSKRLSIALALVGNARVLLLDEPTSGLDSFSANEVIQALHNLSRNSITICATIHSPTQLALQLFDAITVLVRGSIVFSGSTGSDLTDFLSSCRNMFDCFQVDGMCQAEQLIAAITQADRDISHGELSSKYESSTWALEVRRKICDVSQSERSPSTATAQQLHMALSTSTHPLAAVGTLLKYRLVNDYTDAQYLGPRILDKLAITLLILVLYRHRGSNVASSNVNNISSILFMWGTLPGFTAVSYIPSIFLDRPVFRRERQSGLYGASAYLLFKIMEEAFIMSTTSMIMCLTVFFGIELRGNFILFWLVHLTTTFNGLALAYSIAAITPTLEAAAATLPGIVLTWQFFVGLLIRRNDMPAYLRWYCSLNFLRYGWDALMINHFEHLDIPIFGGVETLQFYGLNAVNKWTSLAKECVFLPAFCCAAWAFLAMSND